MTCKSESPSNLDKYAGVMLPEVRIMTQRLLSADSTEKVLNALVGIKGIRQINLKGEGIPATINNGPNRGIANNHTERRIIKFGAQEIELKELVGDFFIELLPSDEKEIEAKVKEIDAAVKDVIPFGYALDVGRYTKYKPTLADYI